MASLRSGLVGRQRLQPDRLQVHTGEDSHGYVARDGDGLDLLLRGNLWRTRNHEEETGIFFERLIYDPQLLFDDH